MIILIIFRQQHPMRLRQTSYQLEKFKFSRKKVLNLPMG